MVMPNRKEILYELEHQVADADWCDNDWKDNVPIWMLRGALTLLQEQEAIEPYMDYDGQDVWRCGKCGNSLMHPSYYESDEDAKNYIRYCSHCGREVKWHG